MDGAIEVEGLRELRRALGRAEKGVPRELNKALKAAGTERVLPKANRGTPVGATHKLQGANRVTTKGDRVLFRNAKPYANTIHWGRKTLRGVPNVVAPRPYLYAAVVSQSDEISQFVYTEIERFVARTMPN